MPKKRGQAAIFMVAAIIILLLGVFFFYTEKASLEKTELISPEIAPVKSFIDECISDAATQAITMLGLGLTFMRGLFKQATAKVESAVSAQELTNSPTTDNVLTITPSELTLRQKDVGTAVIAYLSTYTSSDSCTLTTPVPKTGGTDVAAITASGQAIAMTQDQINTWTAAINPKTGLTLPATGLYTFTMSCATSAKSYTRDIVITVTS